MLSETFKVHLLNKARIIRRANFEFILKEYYSRYNYTTNYFHGISVLNCLRKSTKGVAKIVICFYVLPKGKKNELLVGMRFGQVGLRDEADRCAQARVECREMKRARCDGLRHRLADASIGL